MSTPTPCPFCARPAAAGLIAENATAIAFPDAYPLSPGHALVVPRRHVGDYFELSEQEQLDLWRLVADVRAEIVRDRSPQGFNVGLNVGEAAGQTVAHAHVHVIPRYAGDVPDPRGGIRWVVPGKAAYWDRER